MYSAPEETSSTRLLLGILSFGRADDKGTGPGAALAARLVDAIDGSPEDRANIATLEKQFVPRTPAQAVRVLASDWLSDAVIHLLRNASDAGQPVVAAPRLIQTVLQYDGSRWRDSWPSATVRTRVLSAIPNDPDGAPTGHLPDSPSGVTTDPPQTDIPARWFVARSTKADDPWRGAVTDPIGVGHEARAFARIAAAVGTDPPLSFGIFGDWGSGKSYFMRLIHEHVDAIAKKDPVRAPEAGSGALFHEKIVQIRFNAWHYADTNLWAGTRRTHLRGTRPGG